MIVRPSHISSATGTSFLLYGANNRFISGGGSRTFNGQTTSFIPPKRSRGFKHYFSNTRMNNALLLRTGVEGGGVSNSMVEATSSTTSMHMSLFNGQITLGQTAALTLGTALVIGFVKYRGSINKRLKQLQESSFFSSNPPKDPFRMIRTTTKQSGANSVSDIHKKYNLVSLNDEWKNHQNSLDPKNHCKWGHLKMTSLGDYLSTIRPNMIGQKEMPQFIEREIQNALAAALLKGLGPQFGTAILPILGVGGIRNTVGRLAGGATKYVMKKSTDKSSKTKTNSSTQLNGERNEHKSNKAKNIGEKEVAANSQDNTKSSSSTDGGSLPLSLFAMTYVAEANYQRLRNMEHPEEDFLAQLQAKGGFVSKSPLQKLAEGEVGFQPSFFDSYLDSSSSEDVSSVTPINGSNPQDASEVKYNNNNKSSSRKEEDKKQPLIPNPFVLDRDWSNAIDGMEHLLTSSKNQDCEWKSTPMENPNSEGTVDRTEHVCYDPNNRAMAKPKPLDQRILPDLHLGWGDALCTHTDREILINRLLCVLLNKLAYNYQIQLNMENNTNDQTELFTIQTTNDGPLITKPADLIEELIQMGHSVEACVRTHLTTFGVSLCVKETNNKFTNIPLGYFLQNGQTSHDGQDAYVALPHSGLNVEIRNGPLVKHGSIQHFIGIEGLCGWHSNHNADVPWLQDVDCGPTLKNNDSLQAFRVAALEANVMGLVGTKLKLPLGGYGLTGVCNDSAALVEYALFGQTNVYPLTFNGRFAMENLRVARQLKERMEQQRTNVADEEHDAIDGLIKALTEIKSDINSLPSEASDQIRRELNCLPPSPQPFEMMCQTKRVITSLQQELDRKTMNVGNGNVNKQNFQDGRINGHSADSLLYK